MIVMINILRITGPICLRGKFSILVSIKEDRWLKLLNLPYVSSPALSSLPWVVSYFWTDYWMMLVNVKFRLKSSIIIGKTLLYLIRFQILVMVNFCLKVDYTIKSNSLILKLIARIFSFTIELFYKLVKFKYENK